MATANADLPYDYLNDTSLDQNLKCAICLFPFQSPVGNTECDHTFCRTCIETSLRQSSACPCCRTRLSAKCLQPVTTRIVHNQLDQLFVKCKLCNKSSIQRGNYAEHTKTCPKKEIDCIAADIGCCWVGPRDQQPGHIQQCPIQNIRPCIQKFQDRAQKNNDLLKSRIAFLESQNTEKQKQIDFLKDETSKLQTNNEQKRRSINKMCKRIEELTASSANKKMSLISEIFGNAQVTGGKVFFPNTCIFCGVCTQTRLNLGQCNLAACLNCFGISKNIDPRDFGSGGSRRLPPRSLTNGNSSDEEDELPSLQRSFSTRTLPDYLRR